MPQAPPPATATPNANDHPMPRDTTHPSHDIVMGDDQSAFTFSFPPAGPAASGPAVRRAPPAAIPDFPNATEPRSPPPAVPFSPSPTNSPMSHSPFHSPEQAGRPHARQFNIHQPFATPANEPPSPWQTLAASSGAPTPSIEGGPLGRSSPHLGYPFERLNIGNSWSGTNLFEEPARSTRDPEPSLGDSGFFDPAAALSAERRKTSLPIKLPSSLAPPHSTKSPSPLATNVGQSGIRAQMISVADLAKVLPRSTTLVLDVRPPSSFRTSHIPDSHSITIPSTLLRRAGFDISKLVQMLSPESSRDVSHWREKSDIVLLDADSSSLPVGGVLDGLASKFTREGYTKGLWVVKGGHAAIKSSGATPLVSDERDEASRHQEGAGPQRGSMAGGLTSAAFMQESTASGVKSRRQLPPKGLTIPATPAFNLTSSPFGALSMDTATTERPNNRTPSMTIPVFDNARPSVAKLQPANPFFDNIRQNLELSHGGITERIPLNLPASVRQNADKFPAWLRELVTMDEKESQEQLAQEFYNLELHEQRRLQAVMEWHTKGSGGVLHYGEGFASHQPEGKREKASWERAVQDQCDMSELQRLVDWETGKVEHEYFPFSITAGVERGTKNRQVCLKYKNIWPYDFSRVRLESPPDQDSDYINASFVQPRGTARRYIATQGPLDATYRDFWTLVWEQNVRVIVMITKQFEGGLIKCGNYWDQRQYGHLKLEKVKQTGGEDKGQPSAAAGFDFGPAAATPDSSHFPKGDEANITRTFLLSRTDKPEEPPRKVVQIQCVGWPDFDVPEEPDTLLRLVNDVNVAAEQVKPEGCERKSEQPPVLVHCSAGVGRTGSFIVVDAVLDGLHREIHEEKSRNRSQSLIEEAAQPEAIPPHHANSAPAASSGTQTPANSAPDTHLLSVSPVKRTLSGTPVTPPFYSSPGTLPAGDDGAAVSNLDLPAQQEKGMEGMDVDAPKGSFKDERSAFSKYRGSSVASVSSDNDTRRPSLSSERLSDESIQQRVGRPKPVISSDRRHRSPSPISRLNHPVSSVLEGMRVQRMSLVQTLRQYLFVHRAIIYHYLNMIEDDETSSNIARPESVPLQGTQGKQKGSSGSSGSAGSLPSLGSGSGSFASTTGSVGSGLLSSSGIPSMTTGSASGSTDDESHAKRRASPTEIHPDSILGNGAPGLTKRPSFKKMRPAVESLASTAAGGTGRLGKGRTWMGTGESALEEKSPEEEKEIKR
ncbi:hypothetical protein B9479_001612 [Cryptococcus floricola]|uniref:protein-tyrosine-phosphatase n=1 Tax=Cryptococcus floricola TaxID=2591691 RepID=A0A5D3B457_9TREE|nr:hypothetical protein B9479_001612 [Cryptococcus floricola]